MGLGKNFQCRDALLTWIIAALAVGAGGVVWVIFFRLSCLPSSPSVDPI